jgi:hypothetical protein
VDKRNGIIFSAVVVDISILVLLLLGNSEIRGTTTGNVILVGGYFALLLGVAAFLSFFYVFGKEKKTIEPAKGPIQDDVAAEEINKIKGVLEKYGNKNKVDFKAVHAGILEYARDLVKNHYSYLENQGSLKAYLEEIVTSSNLNAHGHFFKGRGQQYIIGLFRELGLYNMIKYKV